MTELYGNLVENFKPSQRWLIAFMRRYKLALRRRTRISQKLPSETQEKFHQFIINIRIEKTLELKNIFNMDEMAIWFDMAGNFIINPKGEKQFIFVQRVTKKSVPCCFDICHLPQVRIF